MQRVYFVDKYIRAWKNYAEERAVGVFSEIIEAGMKN